MDTFHLFGMLAQAETEGSPILGLLMIGGIIWFLFAVFGKKKDKYLLRQQTSLHKVK